METLRVKCCVFILGSFFLAGCNSDSNSTANTNYRTPVHNDTTLSPAAAVSSARGQEVFQQRCTACHGPAGNYQNNGAANLQVSKIDSISIVNTIINGKGAMPMFAHVMPDSDLAQLEIYVKTLRK